MLMQDNLRVPDAADLASYGRTGSGPWDHTSDLNKIVLNGIVAPFVAAGPAIASMVVKPTLGTFTLAAICILSGFGLMYTHFWLID